MNNKRDNLSIGKYGESLAVSFLKKRNYNILNVNYRTPFGETDIIAEKQEVIVFVEVKTRISETYGPPYLSITHTKKQHMIKNTLYYLTRNKVIDKDIRIDVISININNNFDLIKLEHIKNAVWQTT